MRMLTKWTSKRPEKHGSSNVYELPVTTALQQEQRVCQFVCENECVRVAFIECQQKSLVFQQQFFTALYTLIQCYSKQ